MRDAAAEACMMPRLGALLRNTMTYFRARAQRRGLRAEALRRQVLVIGPPEYEHEHEENTLADS